MTTTLINNDSSRTDIEIARRALPDLSRRAYAVLCDSLYAEPGFSDVEWDDIAMDLPASKAAMAGVAKRLLESGLVYTEGGTCLDGDPMFIHAVAHDLGFFVEHGAVEGTE